MRIFSPEQSAVISNKEIMEALDISQATLWRWTDKHNFPPNLKKRGTRSREAVRQWLIKEGYLPRD